jgi:hypothetical protein
VVEPAQRTGGHERDAGGGRHGVERVRRHDGGADGDADRRPVRQHRYVPYVRKSGRSTRLRAIARRSTLPKHEARRRYVEVGELAALQQIRADSERLDAQALAVGPFARLDANAVAARDGKTRGAITNLFGSQAAFQAETMALALSAGDWIARLEHPDPTEHPNADAWLDALLAAESARGPRHGSEPAVTYASLWTLWLSAVPYGVWSERVSGPSMDEHVQWLGGLAVAIREALEHFGLALRDDVTLDDVACGLASLIEGVWLNQCLTERHPTEPDEPIATALRRGGRLLWRGAIREAPGR